MYHHPRLLFVSCSHHICGSSTIFVARPPYLWLVHHICGSSTIFVARPPYLWLVHHICGTRVRLMLRDSIRREDHPRVAKARTFFSTFEMKDARYSVFRYNIQTLFETVRWVPRAAENPGPRSPAASRYNVILIIDYLQYSKKGIVYHSVYTVCYIEHSTFNVQFSVDSV
jgi:hypothetical protein